MEESPVNAAISGIYSALSRNELVEASMLAEEVMGDIFRQWQKHKGDNEACELVAATCAYVAVMTAMQRHQEAYAACHDGICLYRALQSRTRGTPVTMPHDMEYPQTDP